MINKEVKSPLVLNGKVVHIKDVSVSKIIKDYMQFGIDKSYILKDIKSLSLYKCVSSSYEFFHPFDISGDSRFYEGLQRFDWYYMPWKWEHEITKSYLRDGHSLLEVGCAHGAFLSAINKQVKLKTSIGLELNQTTPKDEKTFKIINQNIQDFQKNNYEKFDVVCSFQVLEHISEVRLFLDAKVNCLKKGGRLVISVPNNESLLLRGDPVLNKPPHHLGRWCSTSLQYLENVFPIKLVDMHYEPLQQYHVESFVNVENYSRYPTVVQKVLRNIDVITGRFNKLKNKVENKRESIIGHTVLAVFEKY